MPVGVGGSGSGIGDGGDGTRDRLRSFFSLSLSPARSLSLSFWALVLILSFGNIKSGKGSLCGVAAASAFLRSRAEIFGVSRSSTARPLPLREEGSDGVAAASLEEDAFVVGLWWPVHIGQYHIPFGGALNGLVL
jgi:hypothetical protein